MTLFRVQRHDTESDDPDSVSLWRDLDAAAAEYNALVLRYRRIGAPEVETVGIDTVDTEDPRAVYTRTTFRNMDGSKTVFIMDAVTVNEESADGVG